MSDKPQKKNSAAEKYQASQKPLPRRIKEIFELRKKERGITQEDMATALGRKRQSITNYMNGTDMPNWEMIKRIAEYLEVSADYLLGLSDVPVVDMDTRYICEHLNLSPGTVNSLKERERKFQTDRYLSLFLRKDDKGSYGDKIDDFYNSMVSYKLLSDQMTQGVDAEAEEAIELLRSRGFHFPPYEVLFKSGLSSILDSLKEEFIEEAYRSIANTRFVTEDNVNEVINEMVKEK